jgi:periplasmic divalent cation tolerance protein
MADEQLSLILVTAPSQAVAQQLAHDLVTARLAACVNVVPGVQSIYAWEGKIEQAEEVLMIIKTQSSRYAELEAHIRMHHPYETPEIVEIPAGRVTPKYWQWVMKETNQALQEHLP